MKENLYPSLPTAPPIEDQGQGYRLQKTRAANCRKIRPSYPKL